MRLDGGPGARALPRVQYSERDGVEQRLIPGCFGIFGHGNVAGVGQALLEQPGRDAVLPRPQRAGHGARRGRLRAHDATGCRRSPARASIGPGATNMVTGAALATINRLPVLLLPGRPVRDPRGEPAAAGARGPALARRLGQRRVPPGRALLRPHQPARAARCRARSAAMRVLTDPVETGAVMLALPQDVQAEAFDWPEEFFERRVWRVRRPLPEPRVARARRPSCCAARGGR